MRDPDGPPTAGASPAGASPGAPPFGYAFLREALAAADAAGVVHVGDDADPTLRYLAGETDERTVAFVFDGARAVCCPPAGDDVAVDPAFPGEVRTANAAKPPGVRAARALADLLGREPTAAVVAEDRGTVLVPAHLPHDAALFLERAGFALESTRAIERARTAKTPAEVAAVERVQRAAAHGLARARALLADATVADGVVVRDGDPVTVEALRRGVDAALAAGRVAPADGTAIAVGPGTGGDDVPAGAADESPGLRAGDPVVVGVSPRGRTGYRGALARTLVVDATGGWERRAHVACRAALRAGLSAAEPGAPARRVREEVLAELAAHGFDPGAGGAVHGAVGHGIGLARRERPALDADDALEAGSTLAVAPTLAAGEGVVRLETVGVVAEGGAEALVEHALSMDPTVGRESPDADGDPTGPS